MQEDLSYGNDLSGQDILLLAKALDASKLQSYGFRGKLEKSYDRSSLYDAN